MSDDATTEAPADPLEVPCKEEPTHICSFCAIPLRLGANNAWYAVTEDITWEKRTCPERDDGKYTHLPAS